MLSMPEMIRRCNGYSDWLQYRIGHAQARLSQAQPETPSWLRWKTRLDSYKNALAQLGMNLSRGQVWNRGAEYYPLPQGGQDAEDGE